MFYDTIDFSGTLSAADDSLPSASNWFGGSVKYELKVNGATVATADYTEGGPGVTPNCCIGLGGVAPFVSDGAGSAVNLTHLGGAGTLSVSVLLTVNSDSGNEEWWTTGTLMSGVLPVELQTFTVE